MSDVVQSGNKGVDNEIEQRLTAVEEQVAELKGVVETLKEEITDNKKHVSAVANGVEHANEQVESLKETVNQQTNNQDATPDPTDAAGEDEPLVEEETMLEDVVTLPETIAKQELTANQYRARFIASSIREYSRSVPAGRSISTGDMRRVLSAGTDCSGHTQTVERVFEMLSDLGEDEVEIVDGRKSRKIVFRQEIVSRLSRLKQNHDVVIEGVA